MIERKEGETRNKKKSPSTADMSDRLINVKHYRMNLAKVGQ